MNEEISKEVRDIKLARVAGLLSEIPDGPLGTAACDQVCRFIATPAIESVLLRRGTDGIIYTLLKQRSTKDTAYPGQFHCPGTILRGGESLVDPIKRLQETEYNGNEIKSFEKVNFTIVNEARGTFVCLVYLVSLADNNIPDARWYPVNSLPQNTVVHHRDQVIPMALRYFNRRNKG